MEGTDLAELYRNRFQVAELPRKNAIWKVICSDYLNRFIPSSSTVVDIACGYGEFLNNTIATRKIAVDLNPDARRFLASEVEFHLRKATELPQVINAEADVVFTSNFLEHLPDKKALEEFLDGVWKSLKPGGRYIILGPNLRYLPGEYWDFYDHHLGLTHLSLSEVLQLKGFRVDVCIPKFLPYTTQGALPTHPLLVRLYLKFPMFWRLLGKQFLVVASKPI